MIKAQLVADIAKETGIEKTSVLTVVEAMMDKIKDSLIAGENVYLRGFGTFELKHRAEKTARNITRNTSVTVPAHNIPYWKPAKDLKDAVR